MTSQGPNGELPSIVVVIFDCVRYRGLEPDSSLLNSMPTLSHLARESLTFTRAVSPAVWTVPSHASILTGLYPWSHQLHARGSRTLAPNFARLPELLGRAGYRTLLLGANPHLNDTLGLAAGFEEAFWGAWWEQYLRHLSTDVSPGGRGAATDRVSAREALAAVSRLGLIRHVARWSQKHAGVYHGLNRFLYGLRGSEDSCPWCVAEWIEPCLSRWLSGRSPHSPSFVLINMMEAHEPYVTVPEEPPAKSRGASSGVRQDFTAWFEGTWDPSSAERAQLTELYHDSIRALDHRLRRVIDLLRESDRWDNTALIVTSDHGQSFGERGQLLHGMGVEDDLARIPLWIRLPHARLGGQRCDDWASLVDLMPTLLALGGVSGSKTDSSTDLSLLSHTPRSEPVWTISDGMFGGWDYDRLDRARVEHLDRLQVAAFEGNRKLVYDFSSRKVRSYVMDRSGGSDPETADASSAGDIAGFVRSAEAIASTARLDPLGNVRARLESWGYL